MIFVTVGTHEQQFNRLIRKIDELATKKYFKEKIILQTGYSDYIPKNVEWQPFYSYAEMDKLQSEADICISHGGPATFMSILEKGKIPIVVPRLKDYDEHVNNHQLDFAKVVKDKGYNIIVVEDIFNLELIIDEFITNETAKNKFFSHNKRFNEVFEEEVRKLFI